MASSGEAPGGNGHSDSDGMNGSSHKRRSGQSHITWDEETIAEHDKLRGTRQKIDEPSTPYHYGSASSEASDNESAEDSGSGGSALGSASGAAYDERGQDTRIMQVMSEVHMRLPAESELRHERATRWQTDLSDSDTGTDHERARHFKQMRSQHYNEFQALQQWRRRHSSGTDADDEGEDFPLFDGEGGGGHGGGGGGGHGGGAGHGGHRSNGLTHRTNGAAAMPNGWGAAHAAADAAHGHHAMDVAVPNGGGSGGSAGSGGEAAQAGVRSGGAPAASLNVANGGDAALQNGGGP